MDAPSDIIYARKQELTIEEIESQRAEFKKLKEKYVNMIVIDTSKQKEDVIAEVTGHILKKQEKNTRKIMKG